MSEFVKEENTEGSATIGINKADNLVSKAEEDSVKITAAIETAEKNSVAEQEVQNDVGKENQKENINQNEELPKKESSKVEEVEDTEEKNIVNEVIDQFENLNSNNNPVDRIEELSRIQSRHSHLNSGFF
jgi:hypothetical protein